MKTFSKVPGEEDSRKIRCPICGATDTRPHWTYETFAYSICPGCSLVYQNPQPVQGDLAERYDEEYFSYEIENEDSFFKLASLGLKDIGFHELTHGLKEKSLLDIGCATGRLIGELAKDGWQVQGVEICRPAAEYGITHHGVPIHIGTLESAGFPDASFSVVNCSHLIEHLTEPAAYVAEVKRVLAPGGWFVITTPNIDGFQAKLMGKQWRSAIADHTFLYSKKTLRRLLANSGFSVRRIKTWGGIGVGITRDFIKKPVDVLAKRFGFGDVMIVAAELITS